MGYAFQPNWLMKNTGEGQEPLQHIEGALGHRVQGKQANIHVLLRGSIDGDGLDTCPLEKKTG